MEQYILYTSCGDKQSSVLPWNTAGRKYVMRVEVRVGGLEDWVLAGSRREELCEPSAKLHDECRAVIIDGADK